MTDRGTALPAEIRNQTGLSPAERARLDAEAKAVAMKFAWAAKSRSAPAIAEITGPMTKEGVIALALVLAEGIPDGNHLLLQVTRVPGDGVPLGVTRTPRGPSAGADDQRPPARRSPVPLALRAVEGDSDEAA